MAENRKDLRSIPELCKQVSMPPDLRARELLPYFDQPNPDPLNSQSMKYNSI
jgi:hypothetical protein